MIRWAVLALAVIGGTVLDPVPERSPVMRGEYRVLEGDFHVHSRFSDGFMSPAEIPFAARRAGLDVVAVTDHNTAFPGRVARWVSERIGGPIVIPGEEITSSTHHVIAIGVEETVPADRPLGAVLMAVHRQRGVAIAAHPGQRYWPAFEKVLPMLDGAEVMHPLVRRSETRGQDLEVFFGRLSAARPRPAAIGSSDHHAMNGLGTCRTLVFTRDASERGVMEALRAGRTVVVHDDGRMTGDFEMISLLEDEPVVLPPAPSYVAPDLADALIRTLGLLALFALAFGRVERLLG